MVDNDNKHKLIEQAIGHFIMCAGVFILDVVLFLGLADNAGPALTGGICLVAALGNLLYPCHLCYDLWRILVN